MLNILQYAPKKWAFFNFVTELCHFTWNLESHNDGFSSFLSLLTQLLEVRSHQVLVLGVAIHQTLLHEMARLPG
jgi:hypothetical protein